MVVIDTAVAILAAFSIFCHWVFLLALTEKALKPHSAKNAHLKLSTPFNWVSGILTVLLVVMLFYVIIFNQTVYSHYGARFISLFMIVIYPVSGLAIKALNSKLAEPWRAMMLIWPIYGIVWNK